MSLNKKEKERQLKASRKSDNDLARDFLREVVDKFSNASQSLRRVFIDGAFDQISVEYL